MKKFGMLENRLHEDAKQQLNNTLFFIREGYLPTWAEENRTDSDRGLNKYLTDLRWQQYKTGKISREKAVEIASARATKQAEKALEKQLARLETVRNAPDINYIQIMIDWKRSATWGYNPTARVITNVSATYGTASGCGYDKESAAIAEAFDKNPSILKLLYTLKENSLQAGISDYSHTACTGIDNCNVCGYGAGYSVLPYFEGGVGANCFWAILDKCGYTVRSMHTKHEDYYTLTKSAN